MDSLDILHECSRILLARQPEVHRALQHVLELLAQQAELRHGTITLFQPESQELVIAAAHGLSQAELARGQYRLGEGITGKVAAEKRSAVVPDIASEPLFLDRTRARRTPGPLGVSFICVPILLQGKLLGTLSVDRPLDNRMSLDRNLHLLEVIASMLATAVERIRQSAEERAALQQENLRLKQELQGRFEVANFRGSSPQVHEVKQLISQVAPSQVSVLIRGESGTGKELVAQAIHYNSPRHAGPFIRVNCAALPETLIESELFGHEKGAFTGATERRLGRFELAQGGSIFLDEIGDVPPPMQVKLLRVLQERRFERVGGSVTVTVDVRVIAATSRPLEELMQENRFRTDLFYRLNVFPIMLPPLRERGSDILLLADHFAETYAKVHDKPAPRITEQALQLLMRHRWPGNVRELENVIERAVLLSADGLVGVLQLPPSLQVAGLEPEDAASQAHPVGTGDGLEARVAAFERQLIIATLEQCRGNATAAARQLCTTARILRYRMEQLGLDYRRFRRPRRGRG